MSSPSPSSEQEDGDDRPGFGTDTVEQRHDFTNQTDDRQADSQPGILPSIYYKRLLAANVANMAISRLQDQAILYNKKNGQEKGGGGLGWTGGGGGGGEAEAKSGTGLVHWMSVMAEHMNQANQDPAAASAAAAAAAAAASVHYMWNGSVTDSCGPHAKEEYSWSRQSMMKQGYEAKMTPDQQQHQGNMHKGVGDGSGFGARSESSSGSPPANHASMLIVPHPKPEVHHVVTQNGSGRKYQCKMCPSGMKVILLNYLI